MNAINHAATALLIHKRWPHVPIVPVLLSVQLVEILWVVLNLLGIESTTLSPQVFSMQDIHLSHMPYSHSLGMVALLSVVVWWLVGTWAGKSSCAVALGVGVFSHIVLDLLVHSQDLPLAPGLASPKLGTGLYDVPMWAWLLETLYGLFCWYVFKGSKSLLAAIMVFNVGAISFYSSAVPGPEQWMVGKPWLFVGFIGVHIAMGLAAIGYFAKAQWHRQSQSTQTI